MRKKSPTSPPGYTERVKPPIKHPGLTAGRDDLTGVYQIIFLGDIETRHTDSTLEGEVKALSSIKNELNCRRLLNITHDEKTYWTQVAGKRR